MECASWESNLAQKKPVQDRLYSNEFSKSLAFRVGNAICFKCFRIDGSNRNSC